MIDALTQVSWLAVALATVAATVVAGVYFGALVPQAYQRVLGRAGQPAPAATPVTAIGPVVCILATVVASAVLVAALDLTTATDAVVFALVVGVGYLVAMTFQIAINPNMPHPLRYGLLNAPFFLVTSLTTSLILVLV
ncbi:hypothetical protein GCM10023340_41950 [Nocardioides marinquilinus]|uniref:DUF1761 domain-containing protein n=1 Tax=Nocardioides marinquilinus TaxID=1210400 RepID=A0ABP9Q1Y5_9ACTN